MYYNEQLTSFWKILIFGKLIKSFEFEHKNNGNPIVFCYNNTINSKGV